MTLLGSVIFTLYMQQNRSHFFVKQTLRAHLDGNGHFLNPVNPVTRTPNSSGQGQASGSRMTSQFELSSLGFKNSNDSAKSSPFESSKKSRKFLSFETLSKNQTSLSSKLAFAEFKQKPAKKTSKIGVFVCIFQKCCGLGNF